SEPGRSVWRLKEFEASLRNAPNRFNSLLGAARDAELSGDRGKAGRMYAQLVTVSERAGPVCDLQRLAGNKLEAAQAVRNKWLETLFGSSAVAPAGADAVFPSAARHVESGVWERRACRNP